MNLSHCSGYLHQLTSAKCFQPIRMALVWYLHLWVVNVIFCVTFPGLPPTLTLSVFHSPVVFPAKKSADGSRLIRMWTIQIQSPVEIICKISRVLFCSTKSVVSLFEKKKYFVAKTRLWPEFAVFGGQGPHDLDSFSHLDLRCGVSN